MPQLCSVSAARIGVLNKTNTSNDTTEDGASNVILLAQAWPNPLLLLVTYKPKNCRIGMENSRLKLVQQQYSP